MLIQHSHTFEYAGSESFKLYSDDWLNTYEVRYPLDIYFIKLCVETW